MFAIELSTSMDWALEILGTASSARAVMPLMANDSISSGRSAGLIRETIVALSLSWVISSGVGAFTFKIMSDAQASALLTTLQPASW